MFIYEPGTVVATAKAQQYKCAIPIRVRDSSNDDDSSF